MAKASSPSPVSIRSAQSRPAVWLSRLSTVISAAARSFLSRSFRNVAAHGGVEFDLALRD
jgi:hypothetical protein